MGHSVSVFGKWRVYNDGGRKEILPERGISRCIAKSYVAQFDTQHMVYFVRDGVKIGASQYCTYKSEDGKCFILDFWVFPEYRGNGTGHKCFQTLMEYTKNDGAMYYAMNYAKEDSHRFWASLGFSDNGIDEYGLPLMIKRA